MTLLIEEWEVPSDLPGVDGLVIEGADIVNQLKPEKGQSFTLYAADTVHPYVKRYQKSWSRTS